MTESSQHALVDRCASEYRSRAVGLAHALLGSRSDAEDTVQQALLVLLTKESDPEADPWPLFAGVVVNTARNQRRRNQRKRSREEPLGPSVAGADPRPEAHLEQAELLAQMLEALESLPEDEREALVLTRLAGLTHREAAEAADVARETITARARRGLDSLRTRMGVGPERVAAALALGVAGVALHQPTAPTGVVAGAAALGGVTLTTSKFTIAAAGVILFAAGSWLGSSLQDPARAEESPLPVSSAVPVEPASSPILVASPEDEAPAPVDEGTQGLEERLARLEAENRQLRAELAAARKERAPTLRERLTQASALPAEERADAGWDLGRKYADTLTEAELLSILETESSPAVLEVFRSMLRGGASSRWTGAHLERVTALLEAPLPQRRACATYLLVDHLIPRIRKLSLEDAKAFEAGQPSDPALQRIQEALARSARRGEDVVLEQAGDLFGAHSSPLWEGARSALEEGASLAKTHEGRRAAYYALGRDRWAHGERKLFDLYEGLESRPELRLAITDALATLWSQQTSSKEFERTTPWVYRLYADSSEPGVRRSLVSAWANEGFSGHTKELIAGLRRLATTESDPQLRLDLERLAKGLEAKRVRSTRDLEKLLSGSD